MKRYIRSFLPVQHVLMFVNYVRVVLDYIIIFITVIYCGFHFITLDSRHLYACNSIG